MQSGSFEFDLEILPERIFCLAKQRMPDILEMDAYLVRSTCKYFNFADGIVFVSFYDLIKCDRRFVFNAVFYLSFIVMNDPVDDSDIFFRDLPSVKEFHDLLPHFFAFCINDHAACFTVEPVAWMRLDLHSSFIQLIIYPVGQRVIFIF